MSSSAELFELATPLFAACERGDHASVKEQASKLSKECLNYQHPRKRNKTALMLACEGNHEECVETLLSVPGLNVNAGYYDLHSALTLAAEKGFIGIVKKLLAVADLNVNAIHQNATALWMAAANGHTEVVKALMSHPQIDANLPASNGQTALMAACAHGHYSTVCALVAHRTLQLHVQDSNGNTAAMIALERNDQGSAKAVIVAAKGNPLDTKNAAGQTVLLIACKRRLFEVAAMLILNYYHHYVDVNAQDDLGMTALMYVLDNRDSELQPLLLKHAKIDTCLRNKDGRSAVDFTRDPLLCEQLRYLEERSTYSWLATRLLNAHFAATMVLHCERCLVLQEGLASEELFALVPRASFTVDYLKDVGVSGLGLQTFLLNLHKELHVPQDPPSPSFHSAAPHTPCKRRHLDSESSESSDEADEEDERIKFKATKGDNKRKCQHNDAKDQKF